MEEKEMYDFSVSIVDLNKDIYCALVFGYLEKYYTLHREAGAWVEFPAIEKIMQGTGISDVEKIRQALSRLLLSLYDARFRIGTMKHPLEHEPKMVYDTDFCITQRYAPMNQEEIYEHGFKFYLNGEAFDITAINQ